MEVVVHQFEGVSTMKALPLAAGLLAASARRDRRVTREATLAIRTGRELPQVAIERYASPDVLAFSAYVWNERYSLEIARGAKARFPHTFVVFGGPSVPRRPERVAAFFAANPFVDALAQGEGELTFRELLRALLDGRSPAGIAGLALPGAPPPIARERVTDFEGTGSPYLDGSFDELQAGAAILETNRGCPFSCTFCDWGQAIASRVHEVPRERLSAELEWIARRRIPYLYIVDANFGIRRRDFEIVREIGALKARHGFPQYVFFHLVKNAGERHLELVFALKEAGVGTHLALSAQDFEPRVLLAVKRENIRLDRALELRRICHQRGIPTLNEMILGLPEQTYASFARSLVQAVTPWPGDAFQLYLARMIENAEMASPESRARYGIDTRRVLAASFHRPGEALPIDEEEEIVVATRAMPLSDWRRAVRFGFFLSAAHNLRLLDVVLQVAWRAMRIDLRELIEGLLGALPEIASVLDRHADSILDGGALVLPADGTGDHLWSIDESVLVTALADAGRFHAQVGAFARQAGALLEEAVRYQQHVTPRFGDRAPRTAVFSYDFSKLEPAAPASVSWSPAWNLAAAPDPLQFFLAYLGAVHARQPTGSVMAIPAGPETARA